MFFKKRSLNEISHVYKLLNKKFKLNKNLQLYLKNKKFGDLERIKMSYDVQSGSYLRYSKLISKKKKDQVYYPLIEAIKKEFKNFNNILDFGCGEMDTSLYIFKHLNKKKFRYFANDISLNRLIVGQNFLRNKLTKSNFKKFELFCNTSLDLPFKNNSIDVIITVHALEPNNKNKNKLIEEFLRVSKKGVILMEPHYESSNLNQKKRMKKFNYVRGLKKFFNKKEYNFKILKKKYHMKEINKSSIFIIKKKKLSKNNILEYVEPKSLDKLINLNGFLYCKKSYRLFPVLKNIPLFSEDSQYFIPSLKKIN
tara:strand:- start:914 stop:1843 length:930 start_codon:yes stop_codon:yes gene_type:complete